MVLLCRLLLLAGLALASMTRSVEAIMPTELVPGEPPIHLTSTRRHDAKQPAHNTNGLRNGDHAPSPTIPVHPLPDQPVPPVVKTADGKADKFTTVMPEEPIVKELVERFMHIYKVEMKRTALEATVLDVLKAERTAVRDETQEKELAADGIGVEFVQEAETQQYRLYVLLQYRFRSAMLDAKRPYVSVMRLTMDCYNTTSLSELDTQEDAANGDVTGELQDLPDADAAPHLECDVLQHLDLPRRNESRHDIPAYIQRQIFHSAPKSFVHNHTLQVFYDALEAQDLALDAHDRPLHDRDTMHYVRFRVQGGNDQDCMVVIEHARGVNTLRYEDTICYEDSAALAAAAAASAAASASVFRLTKANLPAFVLLASLVGASVALVVIWRQRRRQRSGYSYVHSGSSKHVPAATTSPTAVNTAAVAC